MLQLTPSERRTFFIITGVLILAGIFYVAGSYTQIPESIDYSKSDSIFSRLTHQPLLSNKSDITDESRIYDKKDVNQKKSQSKVKLGQGSVDLNNAGKEELKKLPRIGPAMADRIIEFRRTNGPFKSIEEITKVKGIGNKTFNLIKPYLQRID